MVTRIAIIAFGAMCCIFSGCGCSKEKQADDGIPARMKDSVYTNRLAQFFESRNAVVTKMAALRVKIEDLEPDAKGTPAYVDLTNQLAQCAAEADSIKKTTLNTIRSRVMKEAAVKRKGDLRK